MDGLRESERARRTRPSNKPIEQDHRPPKDIGQSEDVDRLEPSVLALGGRVVWISLGDDLGPRVVGDEACQLPRPHGDRV